MIDRSIAGPIPTRLFRSFTLDPFSYIPPFLPSTVVSVRVRVYVIDAGIRFVVTDRQMYAVDALSVQAFTRSLSALGAFRCHSSLTLTLAALC